MKCKWITGFFLYVCASQANAGVVMCQSDQFPPKRGSTFSIQVWEPGIYGLSQLRYRDGQSDLLKSTWAHYNIQKTQMDELGRPLNYASWGGGSPRSYQQLESKTVPYALVIHDFEASYKQNRTLKLGVVFKRQANGIIQKTETIFTYLCN